MQLPELPFLPDTIPTAWVLVGSCLLLLLVLGLFLLLLWAERRWKLLKRLRVSDKFMRIDAIRPYTRQVRSLEQQSRHLSQLRREAKQYLPDSVTKRARQGRQQVKKAVPGQLGKRLSSDVEEQIDEWREGDEEKTGRETAVSPATPLSPGEAPPPATHPATATPEATLTVGRVETERETGPSGARLAPGQQIDRYQVDAFVGKGPLGAIYQGYHLTLGRKVAIKIIDPALTRRPGFENRFLSAVRAAAALDHPNVVQIERYAVNPERAYLVRDFVPGPALDVYVQHQQAGDQMVSLNETLRLVAQAAEALAHAHRQDIIHGRVQPDNLLLLPLEEPDRPGDPPLRAIVTDFGMARLFAADEPWPAAAYADMLPYLSPEQCQQKALDSRSDIYSLGIILYQLATEQFPFATETLEEARQNHVNAAPPPPSELRPVIPESVEKIILKAIAKDPAGRFQSGEEMARALRAVVVSPTDVAASYTADADTAVSGEHFVISSEGEQDQTFPLDIDVETIEVGAADDNDLVLPAKGIAARHARLVRHPGEREGWRVVDLGSLHGTYIDGIQLLPDLPEDWDAGQTLQIGPYTLRWRQSAPAPPGENGDRAAPVSASRPVTPVTAALDAQLSPTQIAVTPGERADVQIVTENRGVHVDHVSFQLEGVPLEWATISENDVQLMPGGRGFVLLTFHPPRDSRAAAGDYAFTVRVDSRANPDGGTAAEGTLTVRPFTRLTADMQPERLKTGGTIEVSLHNRGNQPLDCTVTGRDPAEELLFDPASQRLHLDPGQQEAIALDVAAPARPFLGGSQIAPFDVTIQAEALDQPQVKGGQLEIRPLLPMWVPTVLSLLFLFLCVGGALLSSYLGDRNAARATETAVAANAAATATAQAAIPITATATLPPLTPTPVPNPTTCAMIRSQNEGAQDGEYTLYLNGDPSLPMQIYCHDMGGNPAEYLTLDKVGGGFNYALIAHPEGALTTHYQRLRLDPASLVVDIRDRTFATLHEPVPGYDVLGPEAAAGYLVVVSDYGRAEGCNRGNPDAPRGSANIDLSGTDFTVGEAVTFTVDGGAIQNPVIDVSPDRKIVNLEVGGRCAHIQPAWPFRLAYAPSEAP